MKSSTMLKAFLAAGLLLSAGAVSANQMIAQRGYDSCVDDLEDAYPRHARLVHARHYYLASRSDDMTYFVNSTAWEDGDRVALRTQCLTDRFGRDLLARETDYGRWVQGRARVNVEEVSGR